MKFYYSLLPILAGLMTSGAQAAPLSLNYIGQNILNTGTLFNNTQVGGLSGIDYDSTSNQYIVISDDRSTINPARFYNLTLDLNQFNRSVAPGSAGVNFTDTRALLTPAGTTYAANTVDPESIRLHNGQIYWTNEGQRAAAGLQNPTVRQANLDGSFVRDFSVPNYYNPAGSISGLASGDSGVRNNLAFESLTFSNDGKTLYTATENALSQDGLPATVANGTDSRILAFDANTGNATGEFIYQTDPVIDAPVPDTNFATNGLVELLNVPGLSDSFIAVERSFSAGIPGTGNNIRLYLTSLAGATNILGQDDLDNATPFTRASKELLLDLSTLTNEDGTPLALDNIEGVTFGPKFNGLSTLILVSDNNFSGSQFTQFLAFQVATVPLPSALPLFATALFGLCFQGIKRKSKLVVIS
ncbi:MAG: esterase-like activity of phytase family protein [Methylococcaceae bacterium]